MIVEGVHLLADDVGLLADTAGEQSGLFEDRSADFAIVVRAEDAARDCFHVVPHARGGRQDVACAFDCLNQEGSSR